MERYLYTLINKVGRTGFGITNDLERRRSGYEGHCGYPIEFEDVYLGPKNHIEDLEDKIKQEFNDHLFTTHYKYEWINETIEPAQVKMWIKWEVENTFKGIIHEAQTKHEK
jgi:hypothetical protein